MILVIRTGLDLLLENHLGQLRGRRLGLVTNHTGVTRDLVHAVDALTAAGLTLVALYGPEHGVRGGRQAGETIDSDRDSVTGVPLFSLYGVTETPTAQMLQGVDLLLIDLQDIGARFYTYPWTMVNVMKAAAQEGIPVWVLDRPNPIGGLESDVEGPLLDMRFASLTGLYPVPVRHGLTVGELALFVNGEYGLGCQLKVIPMDGWQREIWFQETGLDFVPMSPNTPGLDMMAVYCGTCLVEGTNLSEGRGTTRPFELVGAPWVDGLSLARTLNELELPGVRWRPTYFTPTFHKFAGEECQGVQVHVRDRRLIRPVELGVHLVATLRRLYPDHFAWREELRPNRPGKPFDRLIGTEDVRLSIERGESVREIRTRWAAGETEFSRRRRPYLLYSSSPGVGRDAVKLV